jgi:hypothetical protein
MKRYAEAVLSVLIPIVMSGCLDEHVKTTVSADGSSERTISMKTSEKSLPKGAFPAAIDSTWTVDWKETGEKDTKYEYTARKKFQTPDELSREYAALGDTGIIGLSVSLEKRFEWFYTYLVYREVYTMRNPYTNVPATDYLTKEEIAGYVRGDKSDSLDKKVKLWDSRNDFEELFRSILAEAERRNDPALPASLLKDKKEDLFRRVITADSINKKADEHHVDAKKKEINSVEEAVRFFVKTFKEVLRTTHVNGYDTVFMQSWAAMDRKKKPHPDSWSSSVQMPGLLTETNSDALEGSTITWKFGANQIHVGPYEMHAASRVTNIWVFVVTGIALLLLVFLAILAAFRRRHGKAISSSPLRRGS